VRAGKEGERREGEEIKIEEARDQVEEEEGKTG
jgi:hypothetical protein